MNRNNRRNKKIKIQNIRKGEKIKLGEEEEKRGKKEREKGKAKIEGKNEDWKV